MSRRRLTGQPAAETRRNHGQHGQFPRSHVPVREPPSAILHKDGDGYVFRSIGEGNDADIISSSD
ncbi:MAG TPA: hypothetical protein V6C90_18850 [Coleofasciculaceae cyanobacterium]